MHTFEQLATQFAGYFSEVYFAGHPQTLYEPNNYFLQTGGKRIRPVLCLMGNEVFSDILPDTFHAAAAVELFHNFTLIHDDIMDNSPLRRGKETLPKKYGANTAILAGDVMMIKSYDFLNKIRQGYLPQILSIFNAVAIQICEGQQLDMDFEKIDTVAFAEYEKMIEQKTSVLLAGSLQIGAMLGMAGDRNQHHIYEFGKMLGMAFQVQDDYLDAYGDKEKFGKMRGGDIVANKKTFLLIHALENTAGALKDELLELLQTNRPDKIERMIHIFDACNSPEWCEELKNKYFDKAMQSLDEIVVLSARKVPLKQLAMEIVKRQS